jgi:DNA-binding NtrC family response regulator
MRLLTIGTLEGQLTGATKIAVEKDASVLNADRIDTAIAMLRSGEGADLLMVDIAIDIRDLVSRLEAEHIQVPIVACGTRNDARAGTAAVQAGAKEYVPLPPDPEIIAAILAAVAEDTHDPPPYPPPQPPPFPPPQAGEGGVGAGDGREGEGAATRIVGRTVADVERDLILETLRHCLGNRTRAANILGISIRTLRNKLTVYAADGVRVPPPNSGEIRGAA